MQDTLQLQEQVEDGACRLSLKGWIDSSNAHLLETWLDKTPEQGYRRIIFCCRELEFVSSAGIRVFLSAVRRIAAQPDCELLFAGIGEQVMNVFVMTGLVKLIKQVDAQAPGAG